MSMFDRQPSSASLAIRTRLDELSADLGQLCRHIVTRDAPVPCVIGPPFLVPEVLVEVPRLVAARATLDGAVDVGPKACMEGTRGIGNVHVHREFDRQSHGCEA